MTKRLFALMICAVLAAAPLTWMTVNPKSGEQLLQLSHQLGLQ